jgi:hypothetical protein
MGTYSRGIAMNITLFKSIAAVTDAVDAGETVHWKNCGYVVSKDVHGTYHVTYKPNGHTVGLFWQDGKTTDYKPQDFFMEA